MCDVCNCDVILGAVRRIVSYSIASWGNGGRICAERCWRMSNSNRREARGPKNVSWLYSHQLFAA